MTDFRLGLIGYGLAGRAFHAPLIAVTPGLELAMIVTGNAERQKQARADDPEAEILSSVEDLWKRADSLDVVVVASPNRTHAPLALTALQAGLGVVVDKPFAVSVAEGQRVIDEAERRKGMLTVYQNRRWDGDFLTLQQLLREKALGEPTRFESRLERWRPIPKEDAWRESGDPGDAGGLLYDLGSHLIDQALVLFGPVDHVYAEVDRRRKGVNVDDDTFLALRHGNGVRSHLYASVLVGQPAPRLRVLGTRAAYMKMHADPQEALLRDGARPGPGWGEEPPEHWGTLGAADDVVPVPTRPGAYQDFYAGVVRALRGEAPPPVDPRDALAALAIIEEALRYSLMNGITLQ